MSTPQPPHQPEPSTPVNDGLQPQPGSPQPGPPQPYPGQPQPVQPQPHGAPAYAQPQPPQTVYGQPQSPQLPDYGQPQQPAPPVYGQHQTQFAPPQQQPASAPKRRWILWVALSAGLVVLLGISAALFFGMRSLSSIGPRPVESSVLAADPAYVEAAGEVDELVETYASISVDEQAEYFPGGAEGYDSSYMTAFLAGLNELDLEFESWATADTYLHDGALSEALAVRDALKDLERSFLAQEGLGERFVTFDDGTEAYLDGEYYPEGTPALNAEREAFAQGFVGQPDANGSYAAAGEELAAGLGVTLNHNFREILYYCGDSNGSTETDTSTAAAYCDQSPGVVYINHDSATYEADVHSPYYIQMIKHEFGHARIAGVCATTKPGVAATSGVNGETITNAFTVLYLGGDAGLLQLAAERRPEYLITEEANQVAQGIHDSAACE